MKTRKLYIKKTKKTKKTKGGQDEDERQIDFMINNSVFNASQDTKDKKEDAFSNKDNYKGRTVLNVYKRDNKTLTESFYKADELIASILLGFHDVNPTYLPQYKKQIEFNVKNGRKKKDKNDEDVDSVNKYTYDLVFHESPFNVKTGGGTDESAKLRAIIETQYKELSNDSKYKNLSPLAIRQYRKEKLKVYKKEFIQSYIQQIYNDLKIDSKYATLSGLAKRLYRKEKFKVYKKEFIQSYVRNKSLTDFFEKNVDKYIQGCEQTIEKVNAFNGVLPTDRVVVEIHAKNDMDALELIRESITQVDESLAKLSKEARGKILHILPKYKKSVKIANKHGLNIFDKTRKDIGKSNADTRKNMRQKMLEPIHKFAESANNNVFRPVYNRGLEVFN